MKRIKNGDTNTKRFTDASIVVVSKKPKKKKGVASSGKEGKQ